DKKSPPLSKTEIAHLTANQNNVALQGRHPKLLLQTTKGPKTLRTVAKELITQIDPGYLPQVDDSNLTLSARILADLKNHHNDFIALGLSLAKAHKKTLGNTKSLGELKIKAHKSLIEHETLEANDHFYLAGYEDLEHSTQLLIRGALEKKIKVEVLDWQDNIVRLTQGNQMHIVQQATKTALESYISPLIMENKAVTKQLLKEAKFKVPHGQIFHHIKDAQAAYRPKTKLVVKPNTANFGIGIAFVTNQSSYNKALEVAFQYAPSVVVEEFASGHEYRFLVMGGSVIGVLRREPANVTGDGVHTIKQLITSKNLNPYSFKPPKQHIKLNTTEKAHLKKQRLTPQSIPPKGKKIYLRENSNVSTGGDPIDVTDTIHPYYKNLAIKATKTMGAVICGVDMMIENPDQKDTYCIIEMNYNPALSIHAYPYQGRPRDAITPLLTLLGFA
ncbi:MAG TPA: hypothetical protein PLO43_04380, partial [Chlamydiales bacterium]|nr:hypothetical protein [Chlamydiales bacterium]